MIDIQDDFVEDLILFFETRDSSYFNSFYDNLYSLAFSVASLITKNHADAEDVVQTAFYTVFNQIETCQSLYERDDAKIKGWFLSIVYKQSKLVVRTHVRNKKKEQSQRRPAYTTSSQQISPQLEKKLKSAIDGLEEKYRTPILLKYTEGLKSPEIAQVLNLNERTLRARITRGLEKIKDLLKTDKHEFEKMLLPALAFVNMDHKKAISVIPKFVNKDLIKAKYLKRKPSSYSTYKIVLFCASLVGIVWLYQIEKNKEPNPNEATNLMQPKQQKVSERRFWDLTKNEPNDLIVDGKWRFINDGMSTEGLADNAVFVILPFEPAKYFKIQLKAQAEFDETNHNAQYFVQGVHFKDKQALAQNEVLMRYLEMNIQPRETKNGVRVFPFESTVYFTDSYISSSFCKDPISVVSKITKDDAFDGVGILIRGFEKGSRVQSIEYIPMTKEEEKKIEHKIKKSLETNQFKRNPMGIKKK